MDGAYRLASTSFLYLHPGILDKISTSRWYHRTFPFIAWSYAVFVCPLLCKKGETAAKEGLPSFSACTPFLFVYV